MLTPNLSDALLVFLYGVMGTLFVQWVMEKFKLKERVEWLERVVYESSCRLLDCEEDMDSIKDVIRRAEVQRLAEKESAPRIHAEPAPAERRTRARDPQESEEMSAISGAAYVVVGYTIRLVVYCVVYAAVYVFIVALVLDDRSERFFKREKQWLLEEREDSEIGVPQQSTVQVNR
jgi:hypothetical protein